MSDKLVITQLRGEDGTSTITARVPTRLVTRLDDIVTQTGRSRTQVIIMALEYALDRIDVQSPSEDVSKT